MTSASGGSRSATIAPTPWTGPLVSQNPATLDELGDSPIIVGGALERRVENARRALPGWRSDLAQRRRLLSAIGDELQKNLPRLAAELTVEQGKPLTEARQEIWVAAHAFATTAALGWEPEYEMPAAAGRTVTVQHRPFGVVAAIVPWNFPIYLAAAKIAPALLAGNTVIVKPAETVSLVVSSFVQILASVLPEGVIAAATGGPETGRQLIGHPAVRKVSFTGSTDIGRQIIAQSAPTITPVTLELGGNDPAILLPDADLEHAAARITQGAFMNSGQMCIAPKRAYVPAPLVDEFAARVGEHAQRVVGDGRDQSTTMGPLHNRTQLDIVAGMLRSATRSGATIVTGGERQHDLPGHFLDPTVLVGVDDSFDIVREEQFGPVLPVVAYRDLDTVLATLDDQPFGLGASVWSADLDRARAVAERIDAGTVWINQHNALDVALPFGGVKSSGFGREGGRAGLDEFVTTRVLDPAQGAS